MTELILLFVISVICMLGLAEIIHSVKLYIYSPKKRAITYTVIYLDKELGEQQLRFAAEQMMWQGKRYTDGVIAVNSALRGEGFENCRQIAERYNIIFCSGDELAAAVCTVAGSYNDD